MHAAGSPFLMSSDCPDWLTHGCDARMVAGQRVTQLNHVNIDGTNSPVAVTSGTLSIFDSQFNGNSGAIITTAPNVTSTTVTGSLFQNNPGATFDEHCEHQQCPMHEQGRVTSSQPKAADCPCVLSPSY